MLVPVYKVTVHNEELGLITYKPFAVKDFSLDKFLSHQPAGKLIEADLVPQLEEVPDWTVPNDIDFVDIGDKRMIETGAIK